MSAPPTISNLPALTPAAAPPARTRPPRPPGPRITRKVKAAIHAMVWQGLDPPAAAAAHGMQPGAFARALTRPSVQALIRSEVQVLKTSAAPKATRRIIELIGQNEVLKVALDAARYIDSGGKSDGVNVQVNVQANIQPGYIIDVSEYAHQIPNLMQGSAKPLKDKGDVPQS